LLVGLLVCRLEEENGSNDAAALFRTAQVFEIVAPSPSML
jgi:hypothetical protein